MEDAEAAWVPTGDVAERGPEMLSSKGVLKRRSPLTLRGPSVTQSSMSNTPMKMSTTPPRSGSASEASFRAGVWRMARRLGGTVEGIISGTTIKWIGLV